MFFLNSTSSKLAHLCLYMYSVKKFALFSVSGLKDEKLIIKQAYTKNEAFKLYSGVFRNTVRVTAKIKISNFSVIHSQKKPTDNV